MWVLWAFSQHGEFRVTALLIGAGSNKAELSVPTKAYTQRSDNFISSVFYQVKSEDQPRFRGGNRLCLWRGAKRIQMGRFQGDHGWKVSITQELAGCITTTLSNISPDSWNILQQGK